MTLKAISIRLDLDLINKVNKIAKEKNITSYGLMKSILESGINNTKEIIIKTKSEEELSKTKILKVKLMPSSKIKKEYDKYTMDIIVQREEYNNITQERTTEQISALTDCVNEKLDEGGLSLDDRMYLMDIRKLWAGRDYNKLKLLIDYKTLRWKWILGGKIAANKYETKALEERVTKLKNI